MKVKLRIEPVGLMLEFAARLAWINVGMGVGYLVHTLGAYRS